MDSSSVGSSYAVKKPWEQRPNCDKIICPLLATLYNQSELALDANNCATTEALEAALRASGMTSDFLVSKLSAGATKDGPLDVFAMDGNVAVEHAFSTGTRDPGPDEAVFEKWLQFGQVVNGERRFYASDLKDVIDFFKKQKEVKEEQNKKGVDAMLGVYSGILEGFGRYDGVKQYLTSTDLHCIFIDAKYPEGWVKHDWGMGSMLAEIISVKTGGCCNMQYCGIM